VAIVVTSPVVRVAANFIMRTSKNPRQRLFSTEEEAIRWLDERIAKRRSRGNRARPARATLRMRGRPARRGSVSEPIAALTGGPVEEGRFVRVRTP